eukprot:14853469-Alexandrium_andersonii.AAC.1
MISGPLRAQESRVCQQPACVAATVSLCLRRMPFRVVPHNRGARGLQLEAPAFWLAAPLAA